MGERSVLDRIADACVPPDAVILPDRQARLVAWIDGIVTIDAPPFAMDADWNFVPPERLAAMSDEERDEVTVIHPELPDAADIVATVWAEARHRGPRPHPLSWRRSVLLCRALRAAEWLGVCRARLVYERDGMRTMGPRLRGRRTTILGRPRWWWECLYRQAAAFCDLDRTVELHHPAYPYTLGICARCAPCPSCGAPYDCECVL